MLHHASAEMPDESRAGRPRAGRRGRALAGPFRRFRRDQDGTTAVEFALVSVPFLALVGAIVETGLALFFTQVMENATERASRAVYTGQFQQANAAASDAQFASKFLDAFCDYYVGISNCRTVKLDVRARDTFASNDIPPPTTTQNGQSVMNPDFGRVERPARSQVVIVRAAVEQPVFVSLLNPNQANLSNGKRLIVGTWAFRTEPF